MTTFLTISGIVFRVIVYLSCGILFCMCTIQGEHSFYEWIFNKVFALCVRKDPEHFSCETYKMMKMYYWSPEEHVYRKHIESHPSIQRLQMVVDTSYLLVWPIFFICERLFKILNKNENN